MQRAVEQSCEDIEHYMPFSVLVSDSVSTLVNDLPDSYSDDGTIERVGSIVAGADELTSGGIRAAALNLLIGGRFADDLAAEYAEYNGSSFWGPSQIYVDFDIEDYYIRVNVVYSVNTLVGPMQRQIVSAVPFYGDMELFLSEEEATETSADDIWHRDNFTRGRYFAQRYGANLPQTFPEVNYYNAGRVASIVSIDLNRPTYSMTSACALRVTQEIEQLAAFDGADVQINGTRYVIYGENIRQRTLIVVIPEDSPEATRSSIYSMSVYAASRGVDLQIEEYGSSS